MLASTATVDMTIKQNYKGGILIEKKVNRWLVLVAGFVFNFSLSGTSAFSIFVNPVVSATGWEQGKVTLAYTIYNLMICIFGIIIGSRGSKIKARPLMYIGSTFFAVGWIVTGFAASLPIFYLGFGVLAGIGGGCLYNFSVTNTIKWFPDKKGFVSGLLLGGAAVGPVFCAPVATALLNSLGVFRAYIILGIFYGALTYAVGWMVHIPKADYVPDGWTPPAGVTVSEGMNWKQMLKTPTFYLLYFVFIFACTPSMMMLGAVASIGQAQAGMTAAMASLAVSLLAISNFCGRMFFGALSDKLGRYLTLIIALAICLIAVLGISQIRVAVPFMVVMCIIGACGGALLVMFPPITSDCFGVKNSGMNYAIMFSAYSIAALVGPQLVTYYKRTTGEYTMAFIWAAVLMVAAGILLFIVMRKQKACKG